MWIFELIYQDLKVFLFDQNLRKDCKQDFVLSKSQWLVDKSKIIICIFFTTMSKLFFKVKHLNRKRGGVVVYDFHHGHMDNCIRYLLTSVVYYFHHGHMDNCIRYLLTSVVYDFHHGHMDNCIRYLLTSVVYDGRQLIVKWI